MPTKINVTGYKCIIFDCDGVLLNSNTLKTEAFFTVCERYGKQNALKLVKHHIKNGGVSRYEKFKYFVNHILKSNDNSKITELTNNYSKEVINKLLECEISTDLVKLKSIFPDSKWLVLSGGDQKELRYIFKKRSIDYFFDGGIYGSPESKEQILTYKIANKSITFPSLFFGDSEYDYNVSKKFKIDFVFCYNWTEFENWEKFFSKKNILCIPSINKLAVNKNELLI